MHIYPCEWDHDFLMIFTVNENFVVTAMIEVHVHVYALYSLQWGNGVILLFSQLSKGAENRFQL